MAEKEEKTRTNPLWLAHQKDKKAPSKPESA